jgi:hypothetical protein
VSVLTPFGPSSLGVTGQATVLSVEVPADPPPAGISEQVITRASEVFTAPTVNTTTGRIQDRWEPVSVVTGAVGVIHTFFGNHDRTYFRGARTQVEGFEVMDPFGCGPATLRFPRVSALEEPGAGTLGWLVQGASVDIHLISGGGGRWILWSGRWSGSPPTAPATAAPGWS